MIIPIRCKTCGKVIADKWEYYKEKCAELEKNKDKDNNNQDKYFIDVYKKTILDDLGLDRYCCRTMMLGHVDIIDNL